MKTALRSLVLACLFLLCITVEVFAASNSLHEFAGSPISATTSAVTDENLNYAVSLNKMAYELIMQGSYKDAEGRLRQTLLFDPELVAARCNLGFVLNKTGRAAEALPHLRYAYKLAPNEAAVIQSLAAAYQLCGNYPAAIALYKQYTARFPNAADAWYIAGIATHLEAEQLNFVANNDCLDHPATAERLNWKKTSLKVYIHPALGLKGFQQEANNDILRDSFHRWSQSGVVSFHFVETAADADIECNWTDNARELSSAGEGGEALVKHNGDVVVHASIKLLSSRVGESVAPTQSEVRALCLHEIGHALGLIKHSVNPDDVMFSTLASALNPSARDIGDLKSHYITALAH